jgi:hypothetical protein
MFIFVREILQIVTGSAKYMYLKYKFKEKIALARVSTSSAAHEIMKPTFDDTLMSPYP